LLHFIKVFSKFNSTAFAAATGMDLVFYHYPVRIVVLLQLLGCLYSLVRRFSYDTFLYPNAKTFQYLLTLIFVNVHLCEIWCKSRVLIGNGQAKPPKIPTFASCYTQGGYTNRMVRYPF